MEAIQVQKRFIQVELSEEPSDRSASDSITFSNEVAALIPINFLAVCLFTTIAYLIALKKKNTGRSEHKKWVHSHVLPCQSCRFYTHHPYLKCAVRPDIAMTDQAIDCSDYETTHEITEKHN